MSNAVAVMSMSDLEKMAQVMVKSRLFGVDSQEQAMTLMLLAQAEGIHPATAMRDYHIVEGKPALKADAMLARFQAGGGKIEWEEYSDTKVSAYFSHPASPKKVLIEWSIDSASKVKVYSKKDGGWSPITNRHTWRSYPRQMLKARVISEGVRATNPGVAVGIYTVEETQDFTAPVEKDITPPATPRGGARERLSREQQDKVDAVAVACQEHLDNGSADDAAVELDNAALDADEMVYFWDQFDAKAGKAIAKAGKALRDARKMIAEQKPATPDGVVMDSKPAAETITPAQHKRLEARIKELGADRDKLKAYVSEKFGIEHLNALTKEAYKAVDAMLDKKAAKSQQSVHVSDDVELSLSDRIAACKTAEELDALAETLSEDDVGIYFDAVAAKKAQLQEGGL